MTDSNLRSQELFKAAQKHIPGGVNSPVRAFGAVGGTPLFFDRASGPYMFDADGKRYIDYVLSWGPMLLGPWPQRCIRRYSHSARKSHDLWYAHRARDSAG